MGINEVHIHCYCNNLASAKMIEACGGGMDSEVLAGRELIFALCGWSGMECPFLCVLEIKTVYINRRAGEGRYPTSLRRQ